VKARPIRAGRVKGSCRRRCVNAIRISEHFRVVTPNVRRAVGGTVNQRHLKRNRKFVDSPQEGDGLELLVPQQESPGFPKHSGSRRDGRGPIRLRPPSRSSASARPHRHIAVPAQVWARLSLYPAGVSAPSWRKGTERGIQNPCVDGPASQGLVAAGRRESTIHANIASGRTQHLYPCSGVLFRRRTSDRRSRRRSIFLNLSLA